MFENFDNFNSYPSDGDDLKHPQFDILKSHVERCIVDMFYLVLRDKPHQIFHVFENENQIDQFSKRVLSYWEKFEDFEMCQDVLRLTNEFKSEWKNKITEEKEPGSSRITDIFGLTEK
jgi:hypothetical protein